MRNSGKGKMDRKQLLCRLSPLLIAVILVAAAGMVLSGNNKGTVRTGNDRKDGGRPYNAVDINGIPCVPKNNIRTFLFMGLDSSGEAEATEEYDGTGQCDTLQVIVLDDSLHTYVSMPVNRDTMTKVNTVDEEGYYLSSTTMQIALAHASGDGMEASCENTVHAVSELLYGQDIDNYASLNMDAIEVLNRLSGGVTVTIEDDFSREDPSLVMGETVTLSDEQAMHFVRGRTNVGDGSNEGRMRRQEQYLEALKQKLLEKCKEDSEFALQIYDALKPYMVTDLSRNDFINLAAFLIEATEEDAPEIEGTNLVGETGFNEFTPDTDSLADAVIGLFYNRIEE